MYYFIEGGVLSVLFIFFFISNNEGEPPKYQIKWDDFFINGSFYVGSRHIHHWLIFLILLMGIILTRILFPSNFIDLLAGFSLTMVCHGLSYQDCFVF